MRSILSLLLFGFILFSFGCNPKPSTEETTETEETTTEETATAALSGENFTVTVLKSDIPSPRKEMKGQAAGTEITIHYGSPSVKGRTIWGDLVSYGEVWRTGANEMTTIEFSAPVMVEGQSLAAGKYGLLTIPNQDSWTIIFNSATDLWGANGYDQTKDVLRVTVTPQQTDGMYETMDFMLDGETLVLRWESLAVPIKLGA